MSGSKLSQTRRAITEYVQAVWQTQKRNFPARLRGDFLG